MTLSFNIIKQKNVNSIGEIKLSNLDNEAYEKNISYADSVAEEIISNANIEKEKIINSAIEKANEKSAQIEKNAYNKGYDFGTKNGYEDGYKEVYEEYVEKARLEAKAIIENADKILLNSNNLVADYMKNMQKEILKTCINISSKFIKEHFNFEDSMNDMLENIIRKYELKGNIIVKSSSLYKNELEEKIIQLEKKDNEIKVFLVVDDEIENGNIIIQQDDSKLSLNIDDAINKLRNELIGE